MLIFSLFIVRLEPGLSVEHTSGAKPSELESHLYHLEGPEFL